MAPDPVSARSSLTVGQDEQLNVPGIPAKEQFEDHSKVPFMTARTFFMTVLVSRVGYASATIPARSLVSYRWRTFNTR